MSAVEVLSLARKAGVHVMVQAGHLVLEAPSAPPEAVLDNLNRHKSEILELLSVHEWSSQDWLAYFEERAAIAEIDGEMPRQEAERIALNDAVATWLHKNPPGQQSEDRCAACGEGFGEMGQDTVPLIAGPGQHAWLHHHCIDAWHHRLRQEAVRALETMGIPTPEGCQEFGKRRAKNGDFMVDSET